MIAPSLDFTLSAVRLQLTGTWSAKEFRSLLSRLDDSYTRVGTVMTLADLIKQERLQNEKLNKEKRFDEQDYAWSSLYYGWEVPTDRRPSLAGVSFEEVVSAIRPFVFGLTVDAVRMESPGWVQLVGALNPLKVLADFISKWRAENTKRLNIEATASVAREQTNTEAAVERERIRTEFALGVLRLLPSSQRVGGAARLSEIISYAIEKPTEALQAIAMDPRIVDARTVSPGEALPPTSTSSPPSEPPGQPHRRIRTDP